MKNLRLLVLLNLSYFFVACSLKGFIALNDEYYFSESPKIVTKENRYFLRFRYSDAENAWGFYMFTESIMKEDKVIFYIPATTSTGDKRGRLQFEEIISEGKIDFIKKGAVFWEVEGKLTPLMIEVMSEDLDSVMPIRLHYEFGYSSYYNAKKYIEKTQ